MQDYNVQDYNPVVVRHIKKFIKPPQTLRQSMLTSKEIADSFLKLWEILHIIIMYMAAELLLTLTI